MVHIDEEGQRQMPRISHKVSRIIEKQILSEVPERYHSTLISNAIPAIITHKPSKWQLVKSCKAAIAAINGMTPQTKLLFLKYAVPTTLLFRQTPEQLEKKWLALKKTLNDLPQEHHENLIKEGLPHFFKIKPTSKRLKQWLKVNTALLPKIRTTDYSFQKNLKSYFEHLNEFFEKTRTDEEIDRHLQVAKAYLEQYPDDFFFDKVVMENFGRLASPNTQINRLRFYKSDQHDVWRHGNLIPLGGKLTGTIIRLISKDSAQAWEKAHRDEFLSGHVEPILVRPRDSRLRVFEANNEKRVYTRYTGQRISEFADQNPELAREVWEQQIEIVKALNRLGINFGNSAHLHNDNFTVELVEGKPVVRVIDFDKAQLTDKAENPVPKLL
ncbi:hypothetical protein HY994_04150 [Candidatus Micrarchaeota archaeon]|nr:hypothetical protein [Candidatus Micrarchaeota archaeon]